MNTSSARMPWTIVLLQETPAEVVKVESYLEKKEKYVSDNV
jgi:hypothetical protein